MNGWMSDGLMGCVCVSSVHTCCPLNHPESDLSFRNGVKCCSCCSFAAFLPVRWVRFRPKRHSCRRREAGPTHIVIRTNQEVYFYPKGCSKMDCKHWKRDQRNQITDINYRRRKKIKCKSRRRLLGLHSDGGIFEKIWKWSRTDASLTEFH